MANKTNTIENKLVRGEKGQAFILVLIFLLLGSLIITPLLSYMSTGLKTSHVYEEGNFELYAADAGVEDALWSIKNDVSGLPHSHTDPAYVGNISSINGKSVNYTITCVADDETYSIQSTAWTGAGSSTSIATYVTKTESGGILFNNAVGSLGGDITMSGNTRVKSDPPADKAGNVFSAGNLNLSGSAQIEGDAYADTNMSLSASTTIDGDATTPGTVSGSGTVT